MYVVGMGIVNQYVYGGVWIEWVVWLLVLCFSFQLCQEFVSDVFFEQQMGFGDVYLFLVVEDVVGGGVNCLLQIWVIGEDNVGVFVVCFQLYVFYIVVVGVFQQLFVGVGGVGEGDDFNIRMQGQCLFGFVVKVVDYV